MQVVPSKLHIVVAGVYSSPELDRYDWNLNTRSDRGPVSVLIFPSNNRMTVFQWVAIIIFLLLQPLPSIWFNAQLTEIKKNKQK